MNNIAAMTIYFGYEKKKVLQALRYNSCKCICDTHFYALLSKNNSTIGISCWIVIMDCINDKLLVYTSGNGISKGCYL